jgi:signal transduction histidine kinase/CheY-like chemotaxis protein/HAMP domain-containing protein
MHPFHIRFSTRLKFGFAALLFFVILLGFVAYRQSAQIHAQTETMYQHPLPVRRALDALRLDLLRVNIEFLEMSQRATWPTMEESTAKGAMLDVGLSQQIAILYDRYLGPSADIDRVAVALATLKELRMEALRTLHDGRGREHARGLYPGSPLDVQVQRAMAHLGVIDTFARSKSELLYAASQAELATLNIQLFLLVGAILALSFLIGFTMLRAVRAPLAAMTDATQRFRAGDLTARSAYAKRDEFGVLSDAFNELAGSLQSGIAVRDGAAAIAKELLRENDARAFFRVLLAALASSTGSQMAAVYLRSKSGKTFEHFESLGLDGRARAAFDTESREGELGAALATRTMQHVRRIPEDSRFAYPAAGAVFAPRELLTIPILSRGEVVALLCLGSIAEYSEHALEVLASIDDTLHARIEGILAFMSLSELSVMLQQQNRELEAQGTELASQSDALREHNVELEMQKAQLDEAARLKTSFLSTMSHELRTPLNSVIALSSVLGRRLAGKIPEEEYRFLEVIGRNGKHLLALINDILDIARIEAGRDEIDVGRFSPAAVASELVSMIQPQAEQKGIALRSSAADVSITMRSDEKKFRHILLNVIANAVKFTEEGAVDVTVRSADGTLEIDVTDTGIGIAEEQLAHIFDEFRQADASTSRKYGGTGLGLTIAKKYAQLLGGDITVRSIAGHGSTFTITLPLLLEPRSAPRAGDAALRVGLAGPMGSPVLQDGAVKTLLLVEDNESAIIQLKDILEDSGYRLLVAQNGEEALGIIAQTIPDAIVLDLMMPGIDGFEVLGALREAERTAHVPVLILTAKQITAEELKFLSRNNVHQLIQKGDIHPRALLDAVAGMMEAGPAEASVPAPQRIAPGATPVVLIVEDNADNMLTVKALLGDEYTVIEAVDGRESIALAVQHKPDLILMDMELPGMHGTEAFVALRQAEETRRIPVIALTASATVSEREYILALGFDAYIAKPIDEDRFFPIIREVLYGR